MENSDSGGSEGVALCYGGSCPGRGLADSSGSGSIAPICHLYPGIRSARQQQHLFWLGRNTASARDENRQREPRNLAVYSVPRPSPNGSVCRQVESIASVCRLYSCLRSSRRRHLFS